MMLTRLFGIDLSQMTSRGRWIIVIVALAAVFGVVGVAFASLAIALALAEHYDPKYAALIVALGLFLLTAICAVLAVWYTERTRREFRQAMANSAMATFGPPALTVAIRHSRLASMVAVAGIGFWLARRLTSRD